MKLKQIQNKVKHFFGLKFLFIFAFLVLGVTTIPFPLQKHDRLVPDFNSSVSNSLVGDLNSSSSLHQEIGNISTDSDTVFIRIATYMNHNLDCQIIITLTGNTEIRQSQKSCSDIIDNAYNKFTFNSFSTNQESVILDFKIRSNSSPRLAVYYDENKASTIVNDDNQISGSLTIAVGKMASYQPSSKIALLILAYFLLIFYVGLQISDAIINKKSPTLLIAVFVLLVASAYAIIVPPLHFPDEHEHFYRIIELSQGNMSSPRLGAFNLDQSYNTFVHANLWMDDSVSGGVLNEVASSQPIVFENNNNSTGTTTAGGYFPLAHMPHALVTFLLQNLTSHPIFVFYALRFTTVVLFISAIIATIKLIPQSLPYIFLTLMVPSVMGMAVAISLDPLVNILFLFSILAILFPIKSNKSKLIALILLLYFSIIKYVYFFPAMIGTWSTFNNLSNKRRIALLTVLSFLVIVATIVWLQYASINLNSVDTRIISSTPASRIEFAIHNPIFTAYAIGRSFISNIENSFTNYLYIFTNYKLATKITIGQSFTLPLISYLIYAFSRREKGEVEPAAIFLAIIAFSLTIFSLIGVAILLMHNTITNNLHFSHRYGLISIFAIIPVMFWLSKKDILGGKINNEALRLLTYTYLLIIIIAHYSRVIDFIHLW